MPKKGQRKVAPLGLTPARRARALEHYGVSGLYARVYEALGVCQNTFTRWRKENPDFQAELDEVGRAVDRRIGELARSVLEQRLEDMRDRRRPSQQAIVQRTGEVVELEGPPEYDVASIRTGLTKLDPSWTHPKQEVEHSGQVQVDAAIDSALAKLEDAKAADADEEAPSQ